MYIDYLDDWVCAGNKREKMHHLQAICLWLIPEAEAQFVRWHAAAHV